MLIGLGLPLIFIPIMAASYDGLKPSQTDQASALLNAARNTGGSIGVSLASNVLAHREQFHQSRLAESAIPSSIPYQNAVNQATHYFAGAWRLARPGEISRRSPGSASRSRSSRHCSLTSTCSGC